jgi:two-component sensor histidine kinase
VEKIELAEYLSDICHDLNEITPNYEVSFEGLEPLFINTDRAIGVALVVTELVANAAKHAYPEETHGSIWVRFDRADGDVVRVSVRDEGIGLASDFETNQKVGLGMRLVRTLAKQMRAHIHFERRARGTEFVLEIPSKTDEGAPAD